MKVDGQGAAGGSDPGLRTGSHTPVTDCNLGRVPFVDSSVGGSDHCGFVVKDSGKREEFEGGMLRDMTDDKIDWELVANGPMLKRYAEHLTKGAKKYPDPEPGKANWMRAVGLKEKIHARKSAFRHFMLWWMGAKDEDHAAAVIFNLNVFEYVQGNETKKENI